MEKNRNHHDRQFTLGVIGGGFMAHAIVSGALEKGFLPPEEIAVSEIDGEKRREWEEAGVFACADNRAVAGASRFLLLAVKPQTFPSVARELRNAASLPVLVSIMAGKTRASVSEALGRGRVARVMPNLPCSVGEGIAGIDASALEEEEKRFVFGLFSSVGETVSVREELLNAVTGVSGSGPAYVYLFLKALADAGVEQGLTKEQAYALALQTVRGGAEMAARAQKPLDELIAAVSSKGGTTVAALESFARDDFAGSVSRAVDAAVRRAEELSE